MDSRLHTQLEKRMQIIRRCVLALGKYGLGSDHYERELAILENNARSAREELERARLWRTLEETEVETSA